MGRTLKWVAGGLFSLFFLVGLAIVLLLIFVDLNSLKPRLEKLAEEQAQIDLRIPGNLSWSFFPYLGIELGEVQIRPLSTPNAPDLASIQKAAVGIAVVPLLGGEIQIKRIHLIQPDIYLYRNAAGIANWELIQKGLAKGGSEDKQETPDPAAETDQPEAATDSPLALNLAIDDLWLDRAAVQIKDEAENFNMQLSDVAFRAKNVSLTQAFPVELGAKLKLAEPKVNLDLNLNTNIKVNLNTKQYSLNQLIIKLIADYPELLNTPITLTLDGSADAQLDKGEVQLPLNLNLSAPDWKNTQLPEIGTTRAAINASLNLNQQRYQLTSLQLNSSLRLDKKQKLLPISLKIKADANLKKQLAHLEQQLSLNEFQQELEVKASQLTENPAYSGTLKLEVKQLRKLLTHLGIELPAMADPTTLGQLLTKLNFNGDLKNITFNQLSFLLDETQFKGQAKINLETLALFLRLTGNKLDADRYLPPPATEKKTETAKAQQNTINTEKQTAAGDNELLPAELIKTLNLDISFNLDKLKINGLSAEKIDLGLTAKDGLVNVQRANLDLYQGRLRNKAQIDVRKEPAKLSLTTNLKNLNLRPLLDDLEQKSIPLRGILYFAGDFTTQGTRLSDWLAHSMGPGNLQIKEGAVTEINLSKEICVAAASLDGRTSNKQWSKDTEFTNLSADINLVNGKLNNSGLQITLPGFEISGYGFYHLVVKNFLYNLGVQFNKEADQQACPVNSTLTQIRWPVECKGSLATEHPDIRCKVDSNTVTSLIAQMAKEAAKEKANKIKEQAKEKAKQKVKAKADEQKNQIKEDARKKLRSLFK